MIHRRMLHPCIGGLFDIEAHISPHIRSRPQKECQKTFIPILCASRNMPDSGRVCDMVSRLGTV